jgi:hypothetical protein
MNRFLITTAIAFLISTMPALAVEDSSKPPEQSGAEQLPTQPGVTPETADEASTPPEGSADTSGGARERSSAPPSSGAATADDNAAKAAQSSDKSGGAKEQSSAPEGSSAADPSKPNPTIGADASKPSDSKTSKQ